MPAPLVQQNIDKFVHSAPHSIAATDGKESLSYLELDRLSNKLAHCLMDLGVSRQDRVLLFLQRSVHCLPAILAILKADAVYVPVDHKAPGKRLKTILKDCTPGAILCDAATLPQITATIGGDGFEKPVISITPHDHRPDDLFQIYSPKHFESYDDLTPAYNNIDNDTAYILYTSGSTGKPKGVMISHRNINCYIDWAVHYFSIDNQDKILGTAPFHFDMSTFDIHCSLKTGSCLAIAKDNVLLFPELLIRFMEEEKVTIWKGISSLLMYIGRAGVLQKERIPTLKKILFGGETLPTKYLIHWMETFPEKQFYNVYGPTEATGISLCHPVDQKPQAATEKVPIGTACKDTEVYLLNEDHTLLGPGQVGELCISGLCLSKGYLNDKEKTRQAFIEHPLKNGARQTLYKTGDLARLRHDGTYEFIDRKDTQVKFMGYRIELSEIEHALKAVDGIHDCAVLLLQSEHKGLNELVAFCEAENQLAAEQIIPELQSHLPPYMIPKKIVRLDCIPRNDRGKVCRVSLKTHNSTDSRYEMTNRHR